MPDFAISTALSGRRNWAQARQDRIMQLQFIKEQEALFSQQIQQQQVARQGIQEYLDAVTQGEVLDQDAEKLKAKAQELKKPIMEGLAKYKGDPRRFMLMGGGQLLNEFKNAYLTSDEMMYAKSNNLGYRQYLADLYMGRIPKPIFEDGQRKEMHDIIAEYKDGKRQDIPYLGSVQPREYQETFSSRYADPNDKFVGKSATRDDVYQDAINQGFEKWQAEDIADNYAQQVKTGKLTPYNFRYEQPSMDYGDLIEKLKYERMMRGEDAETGSRTIDIIGDLFASGIDSPSYNPATDIKFENGDGQALEAKNLGRPMLTEMLTLEGYRLNEETGGLTILGEGNRTRDVYYAPKQGQDTPIVKGKINEDDVVYPESFVKLKVTENGKKVQKTFIKAKANIESAKRLPGGGFWGEGEEGKKYAEGNRTTLFGSRFGNDEYQATVLIPVEYDMKKYAILNDKYGIKSTQQSVGGAATDMDEYFINQLARIGSLGNRSILGDYESTVSPEGMQAVNNTYGAAIQQIRTNPQAYVESIKAMDINKMIADAAQQYGIPTEQMQALFQIESGGDPTAISAEGAMGLGQLMPDTAKSLLVKNPFNPSENILASTKYFTDLRNRYSQYKDPLLPVAAYNWGLGNVDKAVKKFGEDWVLGATQGFFDEKGKFVQMPSETVGYMNDFSKLLGF